MAQPLLIQIKRSSVTGNPGTILDAGELAYSYLNQTLYIGAAGGVGGAAIPIGGDGHYATINSPAFTGDPTAPTPPAADDDTSIATTEWVRDLALNDLAGTVTAAINLNNNLIQNVATPIAGTDAANKDYVDNAVQGLDSKESVRLKSTANLNLASPGTLVGDFDGVTPAVGDRILVTDQTTASENGIYIYNGAAVAMTRSPDADSDPEVTANLYTFVEEGTNYADTGWTLTTNDPIIVDTTALSFTQFNGAASINAGAGLSSSGNTINVGTADVGRIVINANDIDLATTGVAANTYIGFAVDAYGRITNVTLPTTLAGYGITDAQPLDGDLTAIAALTGSGILVRTAADTFATKEVAGVANRTTVTNGNGAAAGDIIVDIASTYAGQTSITTLGTVTTGTWEGNTVGLAFGGTGADLTGGGTADCLVKINAGGTALEATSTIDGGTF